MFDKTILVDLDGTLCDTSWRQHHVRVRYDSDGKKIKKNWPAFFGGIAQDPVRWDVVEIVDKFVPDHNVILMSGRSEEYRDVTMSWLLKYDLWSRLKVRGLYMRASYDNRDDGIVKKELRVKVIGDGFMNPYIAVDDRNRVMRMWKSLGMTVIDVGTGEEF